MFDMVVRQANPASVSPKLEFSVTGLDTSHTRTR